MRIAPVSVYNNYTSQNNIQAKKTESKPTAPSFKAFYDDDELFLGPSNGYSILDLFKSKKPKVTKEEEEQILETWDPDLGDIRDMINPNNNNFGPLEDAIRDYESGKFDQEEPKPEPEPPSMFNYND